MNDCVFCKIANDLENQEIIFENDNFFSILDVNPLIEGHALVISKKHFENILDMPPNLGPELVDCIKNTSLKMLEKTKAQGFNVLQNNFKVAGQVVPHLHFHIIPRKKDDGVKLMSK